MHHWSEICPNVPSEGRINSTSGHTVCPDTQPKMVVVVMIVVMIIVTVGGGRDDNSDSWFSHVWKKVWKDLSKNLSLTSVCFHTTPFS